MFKKLAAILIAATVVGAPLLATVQSAQAIESRTTVKVVKKHGAAHRHHVKRVKVVTPHHHRNHVTVVKHRKHVHHHGANKVVIKKVTRTY